MNWLWSRAGWITRTLLVLGVTLSLGALLLSGPAQPEPRGCALVETPGLRPACLGVDERGIPVVLFAVRPKN